ncbi:MAG TPA: peptide deformylase [Opitutaceae bacterium]|nr:peptide deformylase [Opitutaceae bacterium]
MALPIVHYNHPILRKKGAKITRFDAALAGFAAEMVEAMHAAGGIGLAAQQVGQAVMLCVVDLREAKADFTWTLDGAKPPLDLFMPMVLANPVVTVDQGSGETVFEEGCLSFPGIRGDVVRPDGISVKFQDERGVPHELACNGLLARCVQHEVDHLNGVLFIERMAKPVRAELDDAVKTLAKETRAALKDPAAR